MVFYELFTDYHHIRFCKRTETTFLYDGYENEVRNLSFCVQRWAFSFMASYKNPKKPCIFFETRASIKRKGSENLERHE